MAHCSPLLVAVSSEFSPRLPAAGRGWDGVVLASQMELVSVILRPNGSPELCFSGGGGGGIGRNWEVHSTHSLCQELGTLGCLVDKSCLTL